MADPGGLAEQLRAEAGVLDDTAELEKHAATNPATAAGADDPAGRAA